MLAFRVFGTVYLDAESAGEDVSADCHRNGPAGP